MKKISHNKPFLDDQEIKAVKRVLKSNWLIPGIEVKKLESSIKKFVHAKYAVATNSGSSALHLSLIALGVGQKDEVILPTYTFSGLLSVINYMGAVPVVVDVEKNGFNVDPLQIRKKLNSETKAIIVPHTFGLPAKIDEIKKFKVPIIEDCAHALGSYYNGRPLGGFGDISIFSFYATKVITTGHGGMITTNNKKYFKIVSDLILYNQLIKYKVRYNYQLTDISASIGNAQFKKLDFFIERRRHIASRYIDILEKNTSIEHWPKKKDSDLNYYRFVLKFKNKSTRDKIKLQLSKKGVSTVILIDSYQLLHNLLKQPKKYFPNAEELSKTTLSLPIHPSLSENEINKITKTLESLCLNL